MKSKQLKQTDKNMVIPIMQGEDISYLDVTAGFFEISGFPWLDSDRCFCRLKKDSISRFGEGIQRLAMHTSGGILRFACDSPVLGVRVELTSGDDMSHMPRSGSSGVDLYIGRGKEKRFYKTAMPDTYGETKYEALYRGYGSGMNEWTVNFPLYNGISRFQIGLVPGSIIQKPTTYTIQKPIAFYGSSITQGACASRPGNAYTHILCRWLDAGMVNLGFSGGALGEPGMAELIASLSMSLFIMDYDHNAPGVEHIRNTHENFFKIIRKAQPLLPVIFVTRPDTDADPEECALRRDMIYRTYSNALQAGDKNVYFVDGHHLFGKENRDACTVDECHPNDLGFMRMAESIFPTAKQALNIL